MAEHFVIRLNGTADHAEWVVLDDTGALLGPLAVGTLAEAATEAAGRRVTVLVPATQVLRLQAELPAGGRSRLMQVLPFALEDQLADDIEELHFAAGPRTADGRISVAVMNREELAGLLGRLRGAGMEPQALVAESDCLPPIPGTATLVVDDGRGSFLLRQADGELAGGELDCLDTVLELALPPATGAGETPAPVQLCVYLADAGHADLPGAQPPPRPWDRFADRLGSIELRQLPDGTLPRLAAGLSISPLVNLLQGPFASRGRLAGWWPHWQLPAALAASVLLLALVLAGTEAWRLGRDVAAMDAAVAAAFRHNFPDVTEVRDARAQLDSRLRALGGGTQAAQGRQFLEALGSLAEALAQAGDIRLETINYRTGTMELRLLAPNVETLDQVRQQVSASGRFQAEIQSANAQGEQVQGRLRITVAGA
jgi:general secretion pathway protein L